MAAISQSALLQALGWATLNSFWQVGLLWCAYILARRTLPFKAGQQYGMALAALVVALFSFIASIIYYPKGGIQGNHLFHYGFLTDPYCLHAILTAASLTYIALLLIPTARLLQNWRLLRQLRRSHLAKTPVQYRLYVQKIAWHLGVHKPVKVFFSALVQSPVTIGYLKPLILLPIASFNQLTVQQAEAILLHELAHIRRHDYLINIGITIIYTILYFNPFVRMFVRVAEEGREECCDRMVLQFGYDRLAYAGALLQLERSAAIMPLFALAATGKSQLLSRIEAIVGLPRKLPILRAHHFTGLLASVLSVLALHSLFMVGKKEITSDPLHTLASFASPFSLINQDADLKNKENKPTNIPFNKSRIYQQPSTEQLAAGTFPNPPEWVPPAPPAPDNSLMPVPVAWVDQPMEQLDEEQQQQVAATIDATKKILATLEWKEVEKTIPDDLTAEEKALAHQQYQEKVNKINWEQMQENLASRFHQTNWERINEYLDAAEYKIKLDSLEATYTRVLQEMERLAQMKGRICLPDHSIDDQKALKGQLQQARDSIKILRKQQVVRF